MYTINKFFNHLIVNHSILFFAMIICMLVIIGTLCFHFIEQRDFFASFYFTTITMATVGYGDMAPVTYGGKIVAIVYGFMGAPLFIGLTGIVLQSKFQKVIKNSIHEYHKEVKEAEKISEELHEEQHETQQKIFDDVKDTPIKAKSSRLKRLFTTKYK